MGSIMPAMTAGVLVSSDSETAGLASGVLNSARQVGGTVGVALLGTVMESFPTTIGFACATDLTVMVLIAAAHVTGRTLPGRSPASLLVANASSFRSPLVPQRNPARIDGCLGH
jgi:DHA2 family methylenomycin A resistance protein-like MFS transporter